MEPTISFFCTNNTSFTGVVSASGKGESRFEREGKEASINRNKLVRWDTDTKKLAEMKSNVTDNKQTTNKQSTFNNNKIFHRCPPF